MPADDASVEEWEKFFATNTEWMNFVHESTNHEEESDESSEA
jgi:hypothetical protein